MRTAVALGLGILAGLAALTAQATPGWSWHLVLDVATATLAEVAEGTVPEPPASCDGSDPDGLIAYVKEGAHVEVRARTAEVPSFTWTWKGTKARPGYAAAAAHGAGGVVVAVDATGTTDVERLVGFDIATGRKRWTRTTNVMDLGDLSGPFVALATLAAVEIIDARTGAVRGVAPFPRARFLGGCAAGGTRLLRTSGGTAAIDEGTGAVRWSIPGQADAVAVAGKWVVTAALADTLLRVSMIDLVTGAVRARLERTDVLSKVGGDGRYVALAVTGPARVVVHLHAWVED